MEKERKLLVSRIQTPDGTILTSRHRHDFVSHVDKNGETYFLDGGNDYQRVTVNKEEWVDLSIYDYDPYEKIREGYGMVIGRNYYSLSEIANKLLEIWTNTDKFNPRREWFEKELAYRKENNIIVEE